tara:strand:+ start:227 stop:931 length:705 start_codon:yes stop_codon:yes gene_type:complete
MTIDWSKLDTKSLKKVIEHHNNKIKKDDAILSLKGGRKAILPLVKKHFTATDAGTGKIKFTHKQGISTYTLNKVGTAARKAEDAAFKASRAHDLENRRKKVIRRKEAIKTEAAALVAKGAKPKPKKIKVKKKKLTAAEKKEMKRRLRGGGSSVAAIDEWKKYIDPYAYEYAGHKPKPQHRHKWHDLGAIGKTQQGDLTFVVSRRRPSGKKNFKLVEKKRMAWRNFGSGSFSVER